jgi:ubiquitin carboxyl-terminal hydrolase 5/13
MEEALEVARAHASEAKQAKHFDKVFKDECMMCFRSPFSPDGLYVNLNTFQGFCRHHMDLDHERSGNVLYLHIKQTKVSVLRYPKLTLISAERLVSPLRRLLFVDPCHQ